MNENPDRPKYVITFGTAPWVVALKNSLSSILRWAYTVAVFAGCAYLVFWRRESGWLFLPATFLIWFRRGL